MRTGEAFVVLPILVCREDRVKEVDYEGFLNDLRRSVGAGIQVLEGLILSRATDFIRFDQIMAKAEAILLYKAHLGLGDCVIKIAEQGKPLIIFGGREGIRYALDALEYVFPRPKTWVATDLEDLVFRLRLLAAKKQIAHTKILVLNADYQHWQRWLCRVRGGAEAIKAKFGVEIEYVVSSTLIRKWQEIDRERAVRMAKGWIAGAERLVEPSEEDLEVVARLYLAMKDLLEEHDAQALTMAYGDDPLPVPCLPYMCLRDEGFPAACEADILSLLGMLIVHHLLGKPGFMGNAFVDSQRNTVSFSHCVAPRRIAGYNSPPLPYILRDQHWGKVPGSVSAFVKAGPGTDVTILRLSGELDSMLIASGKLVDCQDLPGHCRITWQVKLDGSVKDFIGRTSGNHHVLVCGDHLTELRELNEILGIKTITIP